MFFLSVVIVKSRHCLPIWEAWDSLCRNLCLRTDFYFPRAAGLIGLGISLSIVTEQCVNQSTDLAVLVFMVVWNAVFFVSFCLYEEHRVSQIPDINKLDPCTYISVT